MTRSPTWAAPLAVFVIGLGFLLGLWSYYEAREDEAARAQVQLLAEQVAARTAGVIAERLAHLDHVRDHWLAETDRSDANWQRVAGWEFRHRRDFQALNWVDSSAVIRSVVPLTGNEAALGAELARHPIVGPLFRSSAWPESGRLSPPLDLLQGGHGIVAYLPVEIEGERRGWVSGVFRLDQLMRDSLPEGSPRGHALRIVDAAAGSELITIGTEGERPDWALASTVPLRAADRTWLLSVSPEASTVSSLNPVSDEVFALGGLVLLLIAVLLLGGVLRRGRQLADSRARYRSLVEGAPEAIVVLDVDTGRFVDANDRACSFYGLSRDALLQVGPADLSPPKQPDGVDSAIVAQRRVQEALAGGEPVFDWVHRNSEGIDIPCEVRLRQLEDPSRRLIRGTMYDIRERREAQRALRESEAKYRRIVDTAHEGVWVIDESARTTFVNKRMAELLGGRPEDILGRSLFDFMDPDDCATAEANFADRAVGLDAVHDFRFRRLDGSHVWTLLSTNPLTDDEGRFVGALAMVADITSQRKLEEQLRQSQKMEAVGRLAGGIAHDFNNILTSILGAADLLEEHCRRDPTARALLDEICDSGERAGALTRQLLAFSRRQVVRPEVVDLRTVVADVERVLRRLIGEDQRLEIDGGREALLILADPAQAEQVVLNLVVNARDSQPAGGTIRVRTKRAPDGAVVLEVEDEGPGVPLALRDQIFEPFFTTKGDAGTGLGLSTVHGILTQCGGSIEVTDGEGGGALFRAIFPAASGEAALPTGASPGAHSPRRLRVLVVEDEPAVRSVVRQALESAGHAVLEAEDGETALALLSARGAEIDLLLTDLVMPGLGGRELAERALRDRPDLALVIMTGYSEGTLTIEGRSDLVVLRKPFRAQALAAALEQAVAATNEPPSGA